MTDVTQLLGQIQPGDPSAADQLLPLVYEELRKLAAARLRQERPGQTVDATGLVHEAYLRLVDVEQRQRWDSRGHFFAAAAEAMRRILVERARRKATEKRGAGKRTIELPSDLAADDANWDQVLSLSEALEELAAHDPQAAELVKLRYFAGVGHQEAAELLGISRRTADRLWSLAKAWLYRALEER